MAFKPNRARPVAGPTCSTCGQPVTADDFPGPRWQTESWFGPDTTCTPNGPPIRCQTCATADMRERFRRR